MGSIVSVVVIFVALVLISGIKILKEYDRAVLFRLGRLIGAKGPGIIYGGSSGEFCAMGESLTQQRRVRDEGLRVVNLF